MQSKPRCLCTRHSSALFSGYPFSLLLFLLGQRGGVVSSVLKALLPSPGAVGLVLQKFLFANPSIIQATCSEEKVLLLSGCREGQDKWGPGFLCPLCLWGRDCPAIATERLVPLDKALLRKKMVKVK